MKLWADSRGNYFVEYAILVGVVALLGIGAFATFGSTIAAKLGGQGERVVAMEGRVRSLDSTRPGEAAAENARVEKKLTDKSNESWESGGEKAMAATRESHDGPRANIVVADSSPAFDAGTLVAGLLLVIGVFLVYRWKRAKAAMAGMSAYARLDELLAPATRWMSTVRAHVAGRLPWTPRE